MKKRFLPFSILLAIMLLGQSISIADNGGHYVPRTQDAASAEQFMASLRANQHTGLIDPALMIKAMQNNSKADPVAPNDPLYWHNMGPDNMGGQTTAVLYDNQSNAIYIGAKGGGVFKSYNNGITWHQVDKKNLMVSCMTQAPDGTIYVGTGDADPALTYNGLEQFGFSGNSFIGSGMYQIKNDVISLVASTDPANDDSWGFINEIAVVNGAILVGTTANLMYSVDNGETWEVLLEGAAREVKAMGNSIVASVARKLWIGTIEEMTCLSTNNTSAGYNESGDTITLIPRAGNFVDFATDGEKVIYAALITNAGNQKGIYVSQDKGASWTLAYPEVAVSPNYGHIVYDGCGLYNYGLVIDPNNSDIVYVAANDLWELKKPQTDGYYVSRRLTNGSGTTILSNNYVHIGIHKFVFNPKNNGEFVVGTDGGVFKGVLKQGAVTTESCNRNYLTTRMMEVAYSSETNRILASGLDHGIVYIEGSENVNTTGYGTWINPNYYNEGIFKTDGQGGPCAVSMLNPSTIFVTYKGGNLYRSQTTGEDWVSTNFTSALPTLTNSLFRTPILLHENVNDQNSTDSVWCYNTDTISIPAGTAVECRSANNRIFLHTLSAPLAAGDSVQVIDPITAKFFVATGNYVYMTTTPLQFGVEAEWIIVSKNQIGTPVNMAISADGNHLFIATKDNGRIYRISNLNSIVDGNTDEVTGKFINVAANNQVVTSVAIDPRNANRVVATGGNYGNENYVFYCDNALSDDPTFTAKQANLPKMPVFSSIIEMSTGHVILGTERGIYKTTDINNPNWVADAENMGAIPVITLKQQTMKLADAYYAPGIHNTGIIYAATYGRGVFRSENYKLSHDGVEDNTVTVAETKVSIYPNPVRDHATISFEAIGNQPVRYQVYDLTGRMVQTETIGSFNEGSHEHSINLGNLGAGSYILRLEQGQQVSTAKFIVY